MKLPAIATSVLITYTENFDGDPIIVRSPGRVNIIGEHTDYNEGFVLPAAIDKATFIAIGKREDGTIRLISKDYQESFEASVSVLKPEKTGRLIF